MYEFCFVLFSLNKFSIQVLSPEGIKVMLKIVLKHEPEAIGPKHTRGNKTSLRGLYYTSPFIRDFQNCRELKEVFQELVGEQLVPHPNFCSVPQVRGIEDFSFGKNTGAANMVFCRLI